jgi:hypothetical protein
MPFGEDGRHIAVCWLFEGKRVAVGLHLPSDKFEVATPNGWTYEGSLSERFSFLRNGEIQARLKYLRTDNGADVFLNTSTGREVYKSKN